jgi:hypothetical protein
LIVDFVLTSLSTSKKPVDWNDNIMPFGILEDRILPHVPGTVHLEEVAAATAQSSTFRHLKHGTGRDTDIVLAPQPSDDPNDPLNWSFTCKISIVAILMFGAFIMPSCFGPLLSAGTVVISVDLQTSIADVTILSGYQLLVAGAWGPFVSALSRKYGKRPQSVKYGACSRFSGAD